MSKDKYVKKTADKNLKRSKIDVKALDIEHGEHTFVGKTVRQKSLIGFFKFWGNIFSFNKHKKLIVQKSKLKDRWRIKTAPDKTYLITMFFTNGTLLTWVLKTDQRTFKLNKEKDYYNLYYEEEWYDISNKMYHLFYLFGVPAPVNREITKVGDEAYFTITPENLKPLVLGDYVKHVLGGSTLTDLMKFVLIAIVLNVIVGIITAIMVYQVIKNVG